MTLFLLPNLLGDLKYHQPYLPASVDKAVSALDGLISESESGGRRYLGRFETKKPAHLIPLALFNKNTPDDHIDFLLEPMLKGEKWGLISDAGLPCIADPGSKLVRRARELGIGVQAFVGPSSITMALMLSGLPAQRFAFHGYLPKDTDERVKEILKLQHDSKVEDSTQIFIEAPHRNDELFRSLVDTLEDGMMLCVAWDLTMPGQGIMSLRVSAWKKTQAPSLNKRCAIFLFSQ